MVNDIQNKILYLLKERLESSDDGMDIICELRVASFLNDDVHVPSPLESTLIHSLTQGSHHIYHQQERVSRPNWKHSWKPISKKVMWNWYHEDTLPWGKVLLWLQLPENPPLFAPFRLLKIQTWDCRIQIDLVREKKLV